MIVTSTTERQPFTPPWYLLDGAPKPGAPVYLLRGGSIIERASMEAELSGPHRAAKIFDFELVTAVRAGLEALLDGPDLERLLELVDQEQAGESASFSADDQLLLAEARKVLAEFWPGYRDLMAQIERRTQIAPILALARFCVGWENATDVDGNPVEFALGKDGQVASEALARLQPLELTFAGNRAYALQYGAGAQEGNSKRVSTSEGDPGASTSDGPSAKAGRSTAKRGRKTPVTHSRRGSGRSSTSG